MSDLTALSNPSCGAISLDGDLCLSDSVVIIASEWPAGYATAISRCHDHVGPSVEAILRISPQAVITVTPLAGIENADEDPTENTDASCPDVPMGGRPLLRLVR
jgi:hypothetical protein